jgi:hypothetical protein
MLYLIAPPLIVISVALLLMGARAAKPWALHILHGTWVPGVAVAAYLTADAWKGSAYSENWAMIGVIFFVWPYTVFVVSLAITELALLRGRRDRHATVCRAVAGLIAALLVLLSLSALAFSR